MSESNFFAGKVNGLLKSKPQSSTKSNIPYKRSKYWGPFRAIHFTCFEGLLYTIIYQLLVVIMVKFL